jgi:geranylgeranyl diphosphate synthase type I
MDGIKGKTYLKNYISRAKPVLSNFIDQEIASAKKEEMGYIPLELLKDLSALVSEGKGLRGALTELAYRACGGVDAQKILEASTFIELFHTAILIHDDFMDRDPFRRGIEATHKKYARVGKEIGVKIDHEHYGNAMAVSLGDSGLYYSWKALMQSGFASDLLVKAGLCYADYIGRLGLGQALDMSITGAESINEKGALKVLFLKSVEYTSILPMKVGAILSGNTDSKAEEAIENYAKCFGWAFQIQDDVLGLFAKEEELGKPIGSDLREGKNTLLMINLRKLGTQEQKDFQDKVLGNQNITSEDVEKMRNILRESGTLKHVLDLGWNYVEEGKKYIPTITNDSEISETLESLIVYMMDRTK